MHELLNQMVALAQQFGTTFTQLTTINIFSLLIGMIAATLFEIPIISRFKRH